MMSDQATHDMGMLRVADLAAAVRQRHPDGTASVGDDALERFVREGIDAAAMLGLTDDGQVLRFVCLPLALSPAQRTSPLIQALTTRVLGRTEWDGRKRLDFIYRHVVPRKPSPASESYLQPLFAADQGEGAE